MKKKDVAKRMKFDRKRFVIDRYPGDKDEAPGYTLYDKKWDASDLLDTKKAAKEKAMQWQKREHHSNTGYLRWLKDEIGN